MSGRLEGKVAFITGVARGQGRSHALRLAEEGADIIGVDLPNPIDNLTYPMATQDDLDETIKLIENAGRKIYAKGADVRDRAALDAVLAEGVKELGGINIVVANAGICPMGAAPVSQYLDVVDVNLGGVVNALNAAFPHLQDGASLIAIGSIAGIMSGAVDSPATGPGGAGYAFSKRSIAQLVHELAILLAPRSIRVNAVHPTNCNTDMLQNETMYKMFRPDLEAPTAEDAGLVFPLLHALPTPWIDPADVSNAIAFLASDESRWITGQQLKIDAGAIVKNQATAF